MPNHNSWFLGFGEKNLYDYDGFLEKYHKDPMHAGIMGFVGFPAAKDPDYTKGHPGRSTCVIVTEVPRVHFEKYQDLPCEARGKEYDNLKKQICERLVEELVWKLNIYFSFSFFSVRCEKKNVR